MARTGPAGHWDRSQSRLLSLAARLNRAVPGAGDQVLDRAAITIDGLLDRVETELQGGAPVSAFRADSARKRVAG